tara:strand:+ start:1113 stop:1565 length:453 start_codon:yes stop_codon:yes gene_type:complete
MGSIQEEWLVYFSNELTKRYAKWKLILAWWWKPPYGFSHCGALKYIPKLDIWEHIQFTHAGLRTSILNKDEASELLSKLYQFEILICPIKNDWHLFRIKELSCVSFIMRLIGFYRWWIITPYQLYCALLKAGYKPFWKKRENHGKKTKKT